MPNHIKLGLFGFGCVGQGLYKVLSRTHGIRADIRKICIRDAGKERPIETSLFTTDPALILEDPEIDVVVELIDDPEAAFEIVARAMKNGKAVVSANKKMIADHLQELYQLQQTCKVPFLYEGSCCASIPIIRNLEEYYDNDLINSVEGIFNGSTNYILTRLFNSGNSFEHALREAQTSGFAESDPHLDIDAHDPTYKLSIILLHAFGLFTKPDSIFHYGISRIGQEDVEFAREKGQKIKLVAHCEKDGDKVIAYCLPRFVNGNSKLTPIENEYNAVEVETAFSESQLFVGKGAGDEPTGSAVLSDISALTYSYKYEYKKLAQANGSYLSDEKNLQVYVRYTGNDQVDTSVFDHVESHQHNSKGGRLTGTIPLSRLREQSWLHDERVSVIEC